MNPAFDPSQGLIVVNTEITGQSGTAVLRLALGTGATTTLINAAMLLRSDTIRHYLPTACR